MTPRVLVKRSYLLAHDVTSVVPLSWIHVCVCVCVWSKCVARRAERIELFTTRVRVISPVSYAVLEYSTDTVSIAINNLGWSQ